MLTAVLELDTSIYRATNVAIIMKNKAAFIIPMPAPSTVFTGPIILELNSEFIDFEIFPINHEHNANTITKQTTISIYEANVVTISPSAIVASEFF